MRLTCPALRLGPGDYVVDVAVHSKEGAPYDYQRRALAFTVTARASGIGMYLPEHGWEFAAASREETEVPDGGGNRRSTPPGMG